MTRSGKLTVGTIFYKCRFLSDNTVFVDALINKLSTVSFVMGEVNPNRPTLGNWLTEALKYLGMPVMQAIKLVDT